MHQMQSCPQAQLQGRIMVLHTDLQFSPWKQFLKGSLLYHGSSAVPPQALHQNYVRLSTTASTVRACVCVCVCVCACVRACVCVCVTH